MPNLKPGKLSIILWGRGMLALINTPEELMDGAYAFLSKKIIELPLVPAFERHPAGGGPLRRGRRYG